MKTWRLSAPIITGVFDSRGPYTSVCIEDFYHSKETQTLRGRICYGTIPSGSWRQGIAPPGNDVSFEIRGVEYESVVGNATTRDDSVFDGIDRAVLSHLSGKGVIPSGVIE